MLKGLKCIYCSHEWIALFPNGIESNTVECPSCRKEGEILLWNKITGAEENTMLNRTKH
jgi:hypothetical protein